MEILLADKQDITRAGLVYVLSDFNGVTTKYVEDKSELLLALQNDGNRVIVLDYTLFDINDAAELSILSERFAEARWLLFCEDLSVDFVRVLIATSPRFSILLKECSLQEIREALDYAVLSVNEWPKCCLCRWKLRQIAPNLHLQKTKY